MREGLEQTLAAYPTPRNRNRLACYACLAQDRPTTQRALALVGDEPQTSYWGDNPTTTFESCRRWAKEGDAPTAPPATAVNS